MMIEILVEVTVLVIVSGQPSHWGQSSHSEVAVVVAQRVIVTVGIGRSGGDVMEGGEGVGV